MTFAQMPARHSLSHIEMWFALEHNIHTRLLYISAYAHINSLHTEKTLVRVFFCCMMERTQ